MHRMHRIRIRQRPRQGPGGWPALRMWSVHHRDEEPAKDFGAPAGQYELIFRDGSVTQPLRHGMEVLRSNDICRWWTPAPRGSQTRPGVRVVASKSYEILRLDLWELKLPAPRRLEAIRWRLLDPQAILLLHALSVR